MRDLDNFNRLEERAWELEGKLNEKYEERMNKELSAISAINEKFALMASESLSKRLRSDIKIRAASLELLFMEEFFSVIPIPSSLGVISMEPLKGGAVLQIDNDIKIAIINQMCNNNDELIEQSRELASIGEKIMENIYSLLLENLREAWLGVTDIQPKLEKIEYEPQFIKIAPPEERVLLATFEAKMGMLNLCIPYPVLEPVLKQRNV